MRIEFDESIDPTTGKPRHIYRVDGEEYPSVTHIMGAEGLSDYSRADESHRTRGTLVHQIADLIDTGWDGAATTAEQVINSSDWDPADTSPALVPYGFAYCAYLLRVRPEWKLVEKFVASKIYRYAGRLDRFGIVDGKRTLVDIKSGEPGDSASVQEALYGLALEETEGVKPEVSNALWLRPNGTFKCIPANELGLRVGISAVILYHYRKERGLFT